VGDEASLRKRSNNEICDQREQIDYVASRLAPTYFYIFYQRVCAKAIPPHRS
jgi:hypothetical protein